MCSYEILLRIKFKIHSNTSRMQQVGNDVIDKMVCLSQSHTFHLWLTLSVPFGLPYYPEKIYSVSRMIYFRKLGLQISMPKKKQSFYHHGRAIRREQSNIEWKPKSKLNRTFNSCCRKSGKILLKRAYAEDIYWHNQIIGSAQITSHFSLHWLDAVQSSSVPRSKRLFSSYLYYR